MNKISLASHQNCCVSDKWFDSILGQFKTVSSGVFLNDIHPFESKKYLFLKPLLLSAVKDKKGEVVPFIRDRKPPSFDVVFL